MPGFPGNLVPERRENRDELRMTTEKEGAVAIET